MGHQSVGHCLEAIQHGLSTYWPVFRRWKETKEAKDQANLWTGINPRSGSNLDPGAEKHQSYPLLHCAALICIDKPRSEINRESKVESNKEKEKYVKFPSKLFHLPTRKQIKDSRQKAYTMRRINAGYGRWREMGLKRVHERSRVSACLLFGWAGDWKCVFFCSNVEHAHTPFILNWL